MIFTAAIILTWLAAAYRIWIFATRPRTVWRAAIALSMTATAIAFTLYRVRIDLDQLLGAPNLTGLAARVIFTIGIAFLLIYLDALRLLDDRRPWIIRRLSIAAAVSTIMIVAWTVAPIHHQPIDDLLPLAQHASVVVYCLAFWAYLIWGLANMSWTSIARARQFRREDPTRSISLLLVGVSAAAAIPALLLWSASVLISRTTGADSSVINNLGDAILPWALLVNAIGALSLLTLPYLSELVVTWRRLRNLQPLWTALTARYQQVHLDLRAGGGPLTRLQLRSERAIIEIHDALRIATIDVDGPSSIETVALGLHRLSPGGRRASDLLDRVDTRDADINQLLELARAFRNSRP